jgi:hypothetical protein
MTGQAARWTTAALGMLCAGLGAVVVFELTGGLPLAPEVTAAPPTAPEVDWTREPIEFEPPSRDELEEIAARPLFSPSRRPFVAVEEEEAPAPVESLPPVELVGVLMTEQQRGALVKAAGEGEATWVREGNRIQGWEVERIEDSRVQLRAGDRLETVELRPDTAVPAKPRPERRRARAEESEPSSEDAERAAQPDEADADTSEEDLQEDVEEDVDG